MSARRIPGEKVSNGPTCSVTEFGEIGEADLAEAMIHGRYPETGSGINHQSDMLVYVISGGGILVQEELGFELHPQNAVYIDKGTPYYFEGENLCILMACSPAWNPDQYDQVN